MAENLIKDIRTANNYKFARKRDDEEEEEKNDNNKILTIKRPHLLKLCYLKWFRFYVEYFDDYYWIVENIQLAWVLKKKTISYGMVTSAVTSR